MQIGEDSFLGEFGPATASCEGCVGSESDFAAGEQLRQLGREQPLQLLEIGRMQPHLDRTGRRQPLHGLFDQFPDSELAGVDDAVDQP